jgi:Rrf2 family protein
MAGNSRLAIAVHVSGMLSFAEQMPMTSEAIAQSVNTNPVVIRRIIGLLTKAGLVIVKMGAGGGARLTRMPQEITLADIYVALGEEPVFEVPQLGDDHFCLIGREVRPVLGDILRDAESGLLESLAKVTLADVIDRVRERLGGQGFCGGQNENG